MDITRTYPVNGKFTPAQRDLYDLVLQAQGEGMKAATAGNRLADIHQRTVAVIKQGLLKLGLITDASGDQYPDVGTRTVPRTGSASTFMMSATPGGRSNRECPS